jgi:hypothetical protein
MRRRKVSGAVVIAERYTNLEMNLRSFWSEDVLRWPLASLLELFFVNAHWMIGPVSGYSTVLRLEIEL